MKKHRQKRRKLVKKIESDVDNCPGFSAKRYQMICQIQAFLKEGCSYREIARRMGVGRNTIAKYREGDPKELCMYGVRQSKLDPFYDFIIECLNSGWSKSKTVKAIYAKGLERDIDAVENSVVYDYSNGFVEGTNSRLKMIKRTMW